MTKWDKVFRWIVIAIAVMALIFPFTPLGKDVFIKICSVGIIALAIYYFVQFEKNAAKRLHIVFRPTKIKITDHKIKSWIFSIKFKQIAQYAFLVCLLLVILISLERALIQWQNIPAVYFLYKIIGKLKSVQIPLITITIASGFFTFFLNREKIQNETEKEENNEGAEEQKRKAEFPQKYPKINKIPLLRNFVRWCYGEGWFHSLFLIVICFTFLGFSLHHLGQFMSTDEPKWADTRVPQLYEALRGGDWAKTYINDKPGILPALLSGPVNLFLDHATYKTNPLEYEHYLFWWRFPILLFNFFMLFLIYKFSKKLLNKDHALLVTILIALNPILIGVGQIVNPDATLWSLSILSFLTFFLCLKTNKIKYIYYSGIFLGLALLSKYFAAFFYIIFFLIVYLEYLLNKISLKQFFQRCLHLAILYGISMLTYTALFPATWINGNQIITGTIGATILNPGIFYFLLLLFFIFSELIIFKGELSNYIRNRFDVGKILIGLISFLLLISFLILITNILLNNSVFDFNNYILPGFIQRSANMLPAIAGSIYTTLLTLTYPVLIGVFLFFIIFFKKPWYYNMKKRSLLILSILIFILLFIFGSSLGGFMVSTMYQMMLYPLYAILSTVFIIALFPKIKIAAVVILAVSCATLIYNSPFYLHYTNAFNLKNSVITEAWGYGGYELAQIMNKLPSPENLTVWVDREGFKEFFTGKSYWRGTDNPFDPELKIDYLILTQGGERIFSQALIAHENGQGYLYNLYAMVAKETPILEYYKKNPEFKICINKNPNNCVRAVKMESPNLYISN